MEYVQRIETELRDKEEQLARLQSEVRALRVQLTDLRTGGPTPTPFAELSHSDAVVEVLRTDGGALSPSEIHRRLVEGGRQDKERSLGGILQALKRRGRVDTIARGSWIVADGA
ncbi:MAG: hypothetical protein ACLFS9_06610 [Nitriliruptoraceae bacterium]